MADSRNKGAAFERDIVKRINAFADQHALGFTCKRNLDQYQTADLCDIQIPRHSSSARRTNQAGGLHLLGGSRFVPLAVTIHPF